MRVRNDANIITPVIENEYKKSDPVIKIGAWRDGGFGDAFYAYSVLKSIQRVYPNSKIELLSPSKNFYQIFHNSIVDFSSKNYSDIHRITDNPLIYYDIWFCLRPMTYSISRPQMLLNEKYRKSIENQVKLHGEIFLKNPRVAENKMYGAGKLPAIDVFNYCLNLDADFYDAIPVISNNKGYINYNNPFKGDYITFHQWAYTSIGFNSKFWPYENWERLANMIKKEYGIRIIQIGGAGEKPMGGPIENKLGNGNVFNSCKIIKDSKLHIDIEGSLIHCCALLNTKAISLTGPSMAYWRHYDNKNITYITSDNECKLMPCEENTDGWHRSCILKHHKCMSAISVDMVFDKVKDILK